MDGLDCRSIAVTAIVISIFMVSQCAGKARVPVKPQQYNAQYREFETDYNPLAEIEGTATTAYPVNPYVFSAEDYDVLQQAESLQGARSIVSYEPQRLDAFKRSSEMSFEWSSIVPPTTTQQPLSSSKWKFKFYEVPRKRSSRIRDVDTRNETSLAYQSTPNQRRRVIVSTTSTTTTKPEVHTPTAAIDRRRANTTRRLRSRSQNKDEIIDQQAAGLMFVLNDRIPRPFGFTTEPTFTTRDYSLPPRQHNHRPTASDVNPTRPKPTVVSRRISTVGIPYYENLDVLTTISPAIIYTIPRRRRPQPEAAATEAAAAGSSPQPPPTPTQQSYQTEPTYQTVIPLIERDDPATEEASVEVPAKQKIIYTDVPIVEAAGDYDESNEIPPTDGGGSAPRDDDRHEYNYSHVERYEEPLEPATKEYEEPDDADQAGDQIAPVAEVQDLVTEGDHHHKAQHKDKHHHEEGEEGGSEEHGEGDHHEEGDKGHKGYKNYHEHEDGEKGHHIKEGHDHRYDEAGGDAKKHHDEAGYHEEHENGEEGEKKKAFHEKGKHNKGHSTKGEHVVHKKDEFEKKIEFYDESHEGGDDEKEGGHHHEHHHKKGHHHKKAHHHKGHDEAHHGHKGHHDKGHHHHTKKGHHKEEGDDHHHHHEEKYGKKGGHEDAKHWHYKKGKRR